MSTTSALLRSARAEWVALARRPVLLGGLGTATAFGVIVTAVMMLTLGESANAFNLDAASVGQPDGFSLPIGLGMAFGSIVIFAVFVSWAAGGYARGTTRTALLHQPGRVSLTLGQLLTRWWLLAAMLIVAQLTGALTAWVLAPSQGVDTSAWLSVDGGLALLGDIGRLVAFAFGWAVLGTLVGVVTRSVPIGLAIGLMWAGPVENVLGDELTFAPRWFPGLLLRGVVSPMESPVAQDLVWVTATLYTAVALVLVCLVVRRRDVTA